MDRESFIRKALALSGFNKPSGFEAYAAGNKTYGGGRPMPNIGASGYTGRQGYQKRDNRIAAQRAAILSRLQAGNQGRYASADWLRGR